MKRLLFCMCIVVILPLQLDAQISTSIAQKYTLWTVVKTINCNYVPPSTDGSSQTWDFSTLTPLVPNDTHRVQYIAATSGSLYPNASMVKKDGLKYTYYDYQANGVFVLGYTDSANVPPDTMMYSNPVKIMEHPITYLNMFVDTFKSNDGKPDSTTGYVIDTVESFGKLLLPHDTIENVIRMKFTVVTNTTIGGLPTTITATSYQWYGIDYSTPLLVVDSTLTANTAGNNTVKRTWYLLKEDPTSVQNINTQRLDFSAMFQGNNIVVTSGLIEGHNYHAILYDMSGRKLAHADISGSRNTTLYVSGEVNTGIYILSIKDNKSPSDFGVIRLMKQ